MIGERDLGYDRPTVFQQTIAEHALLTREEEIVLAHRVEKGCKVSIEKLVHHNLRLVFTIAKKYQTLGLEYDDLISEGCMGLHTAAQRFKVGKGCRFSTYAAFWIKQKMRRAITDKSRTIRTPVHFVDKIGHMKKAIAKLEDELCRDPTNAEIGDAMCLPTARIVKLKVYMMQPISMESSWDDDSRTLGDTIEDSEMDSPEENFRKKSLYSDIKECMNRLTERERDILNLRFGFNGSDKMTLSGVGSKWGVTRERIRQIQNKTVAKVRKMMRI